MSRYIDAEELKEKLDNFISMSQTYTEYDCGYDDCLTAIQDTLVDIPAADVAEVKHGKWMLEREPNGKPYCYHCSVCDNDYHFIGIKTQYHYCPNCGARMDGGGD